MYFSVKRGRLVFDNNFRLELRMTAAANVTILSSQFPDQVRRDLLDSLRSRRINHKFHYDSIKQTQKWLALHAAFAPSRVDPDCAATYDAAFAAAARKISAPKVHLVGLGCGGGQKDARLLASLREGTKTISYTPSDVSVAMVLVARNAVIAALPGTDCYPLVCDLATEEELPAALATQAAPGTTRLLTFFGMIPNFEPDVILPKLASLLRPDDFLLFSANLAPGTDYAAGVQHILPLYDNDLTRDWLLTFLTDLGVEREDGVLRFGIEDSQMSLKRIVADFQFTRSRHIAVGDEAIEFQSGDTVRLFFSYRHTPALVESLPRKHGIRVSEQWITKSGEEGVFLCQKTDPAA